MEGRKGEGGEEGKGRGGKEGNVELDAKLIHFLLFPSSPQRKRTKYTLAHLKSFIQSSDAELVQALHEQNVLTLDGELSLLSLLPSFRSFELTFGRVSVFDYYYFFSLASPYTRPGLLLPLPPRHLYPLLSLLLSQLVLHSDLNPPLSVPTSLLLPSLKQHGVAGEFAEAFLGRFGLFDGERGKAGRSWTMSRKGEEVVREIGMGVLIGKLDVSRISFSSTYLCLRGKEVRTDLSGNLTRRFFVSFRFPLQNSLTAPSLSPPSSLSGRISSRTSSNL